MSGIDIILGAILAFFVLRGVTRGFWSQVLGLAGWLGGLVLAFWFSPLLTTMLQNRFESIPPVLAPLIAFLLIFLFIYFFSKLTANWLTQISQKLHLGWLNRLSGGALGAVKGAIILSLILLVFSILPLEKFTQEMRQKSRLYKPIEVVVPTLFSMSTRFSLDPSYFRKQFQQVYQKGKQTLQEETLKMLLKSEADSSTIR